MLSVVRFRYYAGCGVCAAAHCTTAGARPLSTAQVSHGWLPCWEAKHIHLSTELIDRCIHYIDRSLFVLHFLK